MSKSGGSDPVCGRFGVLGIAAPFQARVRRDDGTSECCRRQRRSFGRRHGATRKFCHSLAPSASAPLARLAPFPCLSQAQSGNSDVFGSFHLRQANDYFFARKRDSLLFFLKFFSRVSAKFYFLVFFGVFWCFFGVFWCFFGVLLVFLCFFIFFCLFFAR